MARYSESELRAVFGDEAEKLTRQLNERRRQSREEKFGESEKIRIELAEIADRYKSARHTPEVISGTWQDLWLQWGKRIGREVRVPPLEHGKKAIGKAEARNDFFVYVPEEFSEPENSHDLKVMMKGVAGHIPSVPYQPYRNLIRQSGWLRTEYSILPPHEGISLDQMRRFSHSEREPMTVNTYAIASQAARLFSGSFFDADNFSSRAHRCSVIFGSSLFDREGILMTRANSNNGWNSSINERLITRAELLGVRTVAKQGKA
ncbi:hypothetical protein M1615_02725 [Patescibacteria group bacterium]|nr:hypothetical protein [Patescibacteria group bacterium]